MKANKAPDKFYTDENGLFPMSKRYLDSDIEYTRTDAFIEKALEWMDKNILIFYSDVQTVHNMVENFKEYMKGE